MRSVVVTLLLACACSARAGVVYEVTSSSLNAPNSTRQVTRGFAQDGKLREEQPTGSIRILSSDRSIVIDAPPAHSYQVIDKKFFSELGAQQAEARARTARRSGEVRTDTGTTFEQVEANEQRSLEADKRAPDFRITAREQIVQGYRCKVWDYYWLDEKQAEYCVAAPASIPGGAEWMRANQTRAQFIENATRWLGDPGRLIVADARAEAQAPLQLGGVVVLVQKFAGGKALAETRLTAVREERLAQELFEVPRGLEQRPAEPRLPRLPRFAAH
jgi:hypothetical protein